MPGWTFTDADRELIDRLIDPFLPDHIFDAHAHLFCLDHFAPGAVPDHLHGSPPQLGLAEYRHYIEWIHPRGRTVGGLFFSLAFTGQREANNDFVAEQVAGDPAALGSETPFLMARSSLSGLNGGRVPFSSRPR